jgi:hypothetical protein
LALIKFDVKAQNEKIQRIEIQTKRKIRLTSFGFDVWLLIFLWPFAAASLWKFINNQRRRK